MLNNKQKAYLRALANRERAVFQLGKDGISSNTVAGISDGLTANELLKFSLLKSCPLTVTEAAIEVASLTQSEIVQVIGRTVVLYKRNPEGNIKLPR
ncbi:RNA-binding protein YhbY [bioreactor metagenome]|uniref:RNA-binding protein YhbY n=1 Tax=bioreactor metagenome TaxID=1076179 RepID=A0A645D8I0_9ZZZZ|nr:YhbY family RNA-binding protein [Erysipelotrichaceae bacterium]